MPRRRAKAFFDRYVALGERYDPRLADLYTDDARIRSTRRYPNGAARTLEMTGTQWKALVIAALPAAKSQGDRSKYQNVRFEPDGHLIRVRADRYSTRKCYWDRGYYLLLARQPNGTIKIVEEHAETQPQSSC